MAVEKSEITLSDLAQRATCAFQDRFGRPPKHVVAAPGRVNIIGEHTDYNDGFVLPMAIDRYTVIAGDVAHDDRAIRAAKFFTNTLNEEHEICLAGEHSAPLPSWAKYIRGVFEMAAEHAIVPSIFDAVVDSSVPLGGGLSSSAALEVATATFLEQLTNRKLDPKEKALLCQQAEHRGAGVPCGIMDQFSSVLCQAGHLMLLDCRNQETKMVPMTDPGITVLIINTNVKHELTGGEYAERRAQCEHAAKVLGVPSLREASMALLESQKSQLDEVHFRRARHVIGEIDRTLKAADAIPTGNWETVGQLMYASHDSLRDDYEVSCPELDVLVEAARSLGAASGVIGSRMTGGGFGGSTVSLVRTDKADNIANEVCQHYQEQTGIIATAFATPPARGAHVIAGN